MPAGPAVRVEGLPSLPAFPAQPLEIPANKHVTLLLDNRVLQTAYPELVVSGGRDAQIRLTYAEALYDEHGQKGNRNEIAGRHIQGTSDNFISGGGQQQVFSPLNWRAWRYLQMDVTTQSAPLRLDSMTAWFTAYPFEEQANISGDIPGPGSHLANRLAYGTALRPRDVYGYSILGAPSVRRRHTH